MATLLPQLMISVLGSCVHHHTLVLKRSEVPHSTILVNPELAKFPEFAWTLTRNISWAWVSPRPCSRRSHSDLPLELETQGALPGTASLRGSELAKLTTLLYPRDPFFFELSQGQPASFCAVNK